MRENIEYGLVEAVARCLGRMPRAVARRFAAFIAFAVYWCFGRLRRVGLRNLEMALPELPSKTQKKILRRVYIHLGWQLVEFCRMSRYTAENTRDWMRTDGLEHYLAAQAKGKGVLIITGHLGAWELSSLYHSLMGHPMGMVIRRLDNRKLDEYVNGIRCLHGNFVVHKDDFGRGLLKAMHEGGTVGILMDTNMTPPQGEFVKFFGIDACTGTGLAHIARKTGAAVLPGFMFWEPSEKKYVLRFGEEVAIPHTENVGADILEGTQRCTAVLESWIRRYPDQWLWIHRRWKTRPAGEPGLYGK
ncbi:Lipid A biosynthesis acyltransferase [Candidatus Sulfotelmatomonas gaucii]|uniref:Lipid A biosynthesis acyltransferase n=1 Tax=Candidatus Sulfuritelmatomonas gaucii TaxID=2043161 RepID=A0A2N9LM45_9BACT|nr:Lipid A biosynthesis acyltransferase [Candidatus Sulfotelmatomonas gaucii]